MESLAREVKSVPKSVDPSSSSSTDASKSICVICLCEIKKEEGKATFTGECSHSFHFGCIIKNVEEGNRICPICRFQWTQVPTCDVRLLERADWMEKKMEKLEKMEHEREKNMAELQKRFGGLENKMSELEKNEHEVEKIKHEMMNELEKRNKIIHELKKENHELKKKIQDQEVEAGEENIGHKDSDQRVEAETKMEVAREPEGRSKKMKKTMVRSSIMTRQKTRELNSK